jgi:hypothetical protein
VRIPITGIGATQKKMEKDPDEIVRLLRALRLATLYLAGRVSKNHARQRPYRTSIAFMICLN